MKNLEALFNPQTIALIGANSREESVGYYLAKNLIASQKTFFFINNRTSEVLGHKTYRSIEDISQQLDLAIIAIPASAVAEILEQCGKKSVKAAIVISAGFGESNLQGKKMEKELTDIANRYGICLLGPNCLGIINAKNGLNASFASKTPCLGNVSLISQSGALISALIDYACAMHVGFAKIVSTGNEAAINTTDLLEYLAQDKETGVIALYTEGLKEGRKFFELAKNIAKTKPVIAIKAGRGIEGKKAASTHTGSLAGNYEIYKAMFKQSGVIAAHSLEEFLDIAKLCAYRGEISEEVAIITNGGGIGVLAVDYCEEQNIKLAKLKTETIDEINNFPEMHPAWSKTNPIDIIGDASPQRYKIALEAALKQENVQTILVVVTPQAMTKKEEIAQVIVQAQKKFSNKDIIGCFLGPEINKMAIEILDRDGVPNFPEIQRAIFAIKKTIK